MIRTLTRYLRERKQLLMQFVALDQFKCLDVAIDPRV